MSQIRNLIRSGCQKFSPLSQSILTMTTSIWSWKISLTRCAPPTWAKECWTTDCLNTEFSKSFGPFRFLVRTRPLVTKTFASRALQLTNCLTKMTVISTCCLTKSSLKKKLCASLPHYFLSSECCLLWTKKKIYCQFQMPCATWSTPSSWQFTFLTWPTMVKRRMLIVWIRFPSRLVTWLASWVRTRMLFCKFSTKTSSLMIDSPLWLSICHNPTLEVRMLKQKRFIRWPNSKHKSLTDHLTLVMLWT